jgi:hypothetical protein
MTRAELSALSRVGLFVLTVDALVYAVAWLAR